MQPTNNVHASASLYVGDLSPDVPESKLYETFNNIGQVQSVRVLRDVNTRRSLGYAYVNFHRVDDAEKALEIMNFKPIGGRPCRIMWSQRDPNLRKSGKGNIFIKNLDREIDHENLRDTFTRFGTILSCKVALNSKGESLGYGFVHFATEQDAQTAVEAVNGKMISNRVVTVAPFVSKALRGGGNKYTNIYVKNLPREMSQEAVEKLFAAFGEITSSKLVVAQDETKTNFGFVNFKNPEQARAAVEALNNSVHGEKRLFVSRAQKKDERQKELKERFDTLKAERQAKYVGVNLYIKNLGDGIDDAKLLELFQPFGEITSAKVMIDEKTKKSKGFGFVCFNQTEEAQKAVQLNNTMIEGKPLYVALAQSSAERRRNIEANMARRNMAKNQQGGLYPGGRYPLNQAPPMGYPNQMAQGWPGPHGPPMMMNPGIAPGRHYQLVPQQNQGRGAPRRGGRGGNRGNQGQQMNMRGQGQQMKFVDNVRNRGPPMQQQPAPQPEQQVGPDELSVSDFVKAAASLPDAKRKHVFGERLFPMVARVQPELAPKITGMLLEMEDTEIVELLESQAALDKKIQEALAVLEDAAEGQ